MRIPRAIAGMAMAVSMIWPAGVAVARDTVASLLREGWEIKGYSAAGNFPYTKYSMILQKDQSAMICHLADDGGSGQCYSIK